MLQPAKASNAIRRLNVLIASRFQFTAIQIKAHLHIAYRETKFNRSYVYAENDAINERIQQEMELRAQRLP